MAKRYTPPDKPRRGRGRPKATRDKRTTELSFCLTPQDREHIDRIAKDIGTTRGRLLTAIIERLCIGGFSPYVGFKTCWQLQNKLRELGQEPTGELYFGLRPLPPLAFDEPPAEVMKPLVTPTQKHTQNA